MKIQFKIDKQFLLHESGTKFYQVLRITQGAWPATTKVVTIRNWGKFTGEPGPVPIQLSGERQVKPCDEYQDLIKTKKARGYLASEVSWGTSARFIKLDSLETYLKAELGATMTQSVLETLGVRDAVATDVVSRDDIRMIPAASPAKKTPPPAKFEAAEQEGWGEF